MHNETLKKKAKVNFNMTKNVKSTRTKLADSYDEKYFMKIQINSQTTHHYIPLNF